MTFFWEEVFDVCSGITNLETHSRITLVREAATISNSNSQIWRNETNSRRHEQQSFRSHPWLTGLALLAFRFWCSLSSVGCLRTNWCNIKRVKHIRCSQRPWQSALLWLLRLRSSSTRQLFCFFEVRCTGACGRTYGAICTRRTTIRGRIFALVLAVYAALSPPHACGVERTASSLAVDDAPALGTMFFAFSLARGMRRISKG